MSIEIEDLDNVLPDLERETLGTVFHKSSITHGAPESFEITRGRLPGQQPVGPSGIDYFVLFDPKKSRPNPSRCVAAVERLETGSLHFVLSAPAEDYTGDAPDLRELTQTVMGELALSRIVLHRDTDASFPEAMLRDAGGTVVGNYIQFDRIPEAPVQAPGEVGQFMPQAPQTPPTLTLVQEAA